MLHNITSHCIASVLHGVITYATLNIMIHATFHDFSKQDIHAEQKAPDMTATPGCPTSFNASKVIPRYGGVGRSKQELGLTVNDGGHEELGAINGSGGLGAGHLEGMDAMLDC